MTMEHPSRFAASDPDRPAVIAAETGQVLTYGQLEARSNQLAHALRARGLGIGAHVAIVVENRPEYFEAVWGALRAGAYVTPINWHLSADEIDYVVRDSGADVLIASATCAPSLTAGIGGIRLVLGGVHEGFESFEAVIAAHPTTPIADECEGSWMFYSSGTTGRPKGIKPASIGTPLGAPTAFVGLVQMLYGGSESTRYLSPAPLYHAAPSGWSTAIHRLGGTVVITERFDAVGFLDAIDRYGVTLAQVVPTHMVRLLKLPESERARFSLASLDKLVHAAAPCPPDVKRAMIDWLGLRVYEYYSGSEGAGFCMIGPEEALAHPGSVGKSLLGAAHIVDEDGNELPARAEGQIWFESPTRFEYHGDEEKTAAAYNDRGWTSLGDVGWLDEDGYLYLTDRVSNMIISGGVNIYPREVEDALIGHPAVADVAVIGVADDEMGEAVRAVVQPEAPVADPAALEQELIAYARTRIAHFKCPRSIVFLDELPRLQTGKIARRLLPDSVTTVTDR